MWNLVRPAATSDSAFGPAPSIALENPDGKCVMRRFAWIIGNDPYDRVPNWHRPNESWCWCNGFSRSVEKANRFVQSAIVGDGPMHIYIGYLKTMLTVRGDEEFGSSSRWLAFG